MIAKQRVARAIRMLIENPLVMRWEQRTVFRRIERGPSAQVASDADVGHILIAPPGAGNIGDQAMLEAFVASVSGTVTVIARRGSDVLELPQEIADRVRIVVMPHLIYGLPWQAVRDSLRLARLVERSDSLSVIGADVMDGAYWESASIRRFRAARIAARAGRKARILGFSWNSNPSRGARLAMAAASREVVLLPRDPMSAKRLRADGAENVVEAADIAFLTKPRSLQHPDLEAWIAAQGSRPIVILNANGLLEATTGQVDLYRSMIEANVTRGISFLVLPHVSRGKPNDIQLAQEIGSRFAGMDELFVIDHLLAPGQVAQLASRAALIVSGRMHLTILGTSVGTPAVTIAYQGKVAGLYDVLGIDTWLESGPTAREQLPGMMAHALTRLPELRASVSAALPGLLERARVNVADLQGSATQPSARG